MSKKIRKFLVVVDDTSECHRAISYASRRAMQTKGKITLLRVVNTSDFKNVYGVEAIMKQEAEENAREILKHIRKCECRHWFSSRTSCKVWATNHRNY